MDDLIRVIAALNRGAVDDLMKLCTRDCRLVMPDGTTLEREEMAELHRALVMAFPRLRGELIRAVVSEGAIAAELRVSGVHDGPLCTGVNLLPPTGARVSYRTCDVITFREGKIATWHTYFDPAALYEEIGQAV